jgi:peptide/nickel transport system permease protein
MGLESWVRNFESNIRPVMKESKFVIRKVIRNPLSLVGVVILLSFVVIALLAPLLAPPLPAKNPYEIPYNGPIWGWLIPPPPEPPSDQHFFGTLEGYDIYYGVIWGTRTSFYTSLVVLAIALVIGMLIGCFAGYFGGLIDVFMMRVTDIFFAFPSLLLILIFLLTMPSAWSVNLNPLNFTVVFSHIDKLIIANILVSWPSYARLTRAEIMKVKCEDYVESAKAVGCSNFRVIIRHILPNAVYPVLTMAFLGMGTIVLSFATLSFLGFGPEMGYRLKIGSQGFIPIYADWGTILNHSVMWFQLYPYVIIMPIVFVSLFILAWSLLGDAFGDILDPTIRRKLS